MAETNRTRFFQTKPLDQVLYTTLEFYNPNAGLRRFVASQVLPKEFTLEADAPRNASAIVEFEPVSMEAPEPEIGEDGAELDINLGAVGLEGYEYLNAVMSAWPPTIDIVWRQYLSGVTQPVGVLYLQAEAPSINLQSLTMRASQVNPRGRSVALIAKEDKYLGLRGAL